MTREDARSMFSGYLENTLEPATRDQLQAFLALQPEAAAELITLERTLSLLHRLPAPEPSLDLWQTLAPEVEAYRAERRLNLWVRLRWQWALLLSSVSEGIILWTHVLAGRADHGLSRHLHRKPWLPFQAAEHKE